MKRLSLITLLAAAVALLFAACDKDISLAPENQDKSLTFDLSMGGINHDMEDNKTETKAMKMASEDGRVCIPLEYRAADGIGEMSRGGEAQTRGTQYNLQSELQALGSFRVTAWSSDASGFIPVAGETATYGIVNYNSTNGRWTLAGTSPLWKNADVKTFFAYTNLPEGATVTCESNAFHTFTYTALQTDADAQKDALLGYYQGNGDRDGDGVADGVAKIQFIHPLTAVVFEQGDFDGITAIKSLTIDGVYDGGAAVVTYAYTDGKLVPTFDWGTSRSTTTAVTQSIPADGQFPGKGKQLGEPFIILPQDLSAKEVVIKAVVTATAGGDQEISAELNTGTWKEGKTNTYTLGYDAHTYSYTFTLSGGETSGKEAFTNTSSSDSKSVTIVNNRKDEVGTESAGEWLIKSVQVGAGEPEPVNSTSFSDKGGLTVSQTNAATLSITAASRTPVKPGSNAYWRNTDSRTDNIGWSPEDWSSEGTIDLSTFDAYTDTKNDHLMTSANCYVIRHAGTYKLPLVYGNAVVNGETNESSYHPDDIEAHDRLNKFPNSKGVGIESPYIENAADCGGSDLKCAIIWQDKAEVVKNLQITPGTPSVSEGSYTSDNVRYLQFSISQNDICQNNALVCVYKDADSNGSYDEGEAIWSWHIWTTNDPALIAGPIQVINYTDVEYNFFPLYNLGWKDATNYPGRDDVKIVLVQKKSGHEIELTVKQNPVRGNSNGCFYQFGRKDPMCTTDTPAYPGGWKFDENVVSGQTTLSNAICNPGKFYTGVPEYEWCTVTYRNLWTGKCTTTGGLDQNSDLIKTIYDPSPVGYKLPASRAFTSFTNGGGNVEGSINLFNVANPDTYRSDNGLVFLHCQIEC